MLHIKQIHSHAFLSRFCLSSCWNIEPPVKTLAAEATGQRKRWHMTTDRYDATPRSSIIQITTLLLIQRLSTALPLGCYWTYMARERETVPFLSRSTCSSTNEDHHWAVFEQLWQQLGSVPLEDQVTPGLQLLKHISNQLLLVFNTLGRESRLTSAYWQAQNQTCTVVTWGDGCVNELTSEICLEEKQLFERTSILLWTWQPSRSVSRRWRVRYRLDHQNWVSALLPPQGMTKVHAIGWYLPTPEQYISYDMQVQINTAYCCHIQRYSTVLYCIMVQSRANN